MPDTSAILEVTDLTVRYPAFTLGPLSLRIRGGETVALLGANAAGKTTLLRAVTGRLRDRLGTILLAGREPREAPPAWRARVGFAGEKPLVDGALRLDSLRLDLLATACAGHEHGRVSADPGRAYRHPHASSARRSCERARALQNRWACRPRS